MKESVKSYQSYSLLGKLFDRARTLCDRIPVGFGDKSGCVSSHDTSHEVYSSQKLLDSFTFSLDSSLRVPHATDFLQLAQRLLDGFVSDKATFGTCTEGFGVSANIDTSSDAKQSEFISTPMDLGGIFWVTSSSSLAYLRTQQKPDIISR